MLHVQWNRKARMVSVLLSYALRIIPRHWNIPVVLVHQLKNHCKMDTHYVGWVLVFFLHCPITFLEPASERRTLRCAPVTWFFTHIGHFCYLIYYKFIILVLFFVFVLLCISCDATLLAHWHSITICLCINIFVSCPQTSYPSLYSN
jgi:hypothetical protein